MRAEGVDFDRCAPASATIIDPCTREQPAWSESLDGNRSGASGRDRGFADNRFVDTRFGDSSSSDTRFGDGPLSDRAPSASRLSARREPVWLFDLDNTLHDAASAVFPRIRDAMAEFIARELSIDLRAAQELRNEFWLRHGATLPGLVHEFGIDAQRFLRETHAFPELWRLVPRDPKLIDALRRLPGRRIVCTNAPREYAVQVVRRLGIAPWIDAIVAIESMRFAGRWQPKPSRAMLRRVVAWLQVPAARCVLIEDTPANLAAARALGMRTVLVRGTTGRLHRPAQRLRAGTSRHIGVQVQSVAQLPRISARFASSSCAGTARRTE